MIYPALKLGDEKEDFLKFIFILSLLLANSVFAEELNFNCKQLLNGNYSGKAYDVATSIDFNIVIKLDKKNGELHGSMTTEEDSTPTTIYSYFIDNNVPKFEQTGNLIKISSYESNALLCGLSDSSCRDWHKLTLDTKTGNGIFQQSSSNKMFFGGVTQWISIQFNCTSR